VVGVVVRGGSQPQASPTTNPKGKKSTTTTWKKVAGVRNDPPTYTAKPRAHDDPMIATQPANLGSVRMPFWLMVWGGSKSIRSIGWGKTRGQQETTCAPAVVVSEAK